MDGYSKSKRTVLSLDMDLNGVGVVAAKNGVAASVNLYAPQLSEPTAQLLDQVKTKWNEETRRAAIFMEEAARKFKEANPNGKVILVGHSAFTNAIDQVRLDDGNGNRIVDFRVMSSPLITDLTHKDRNRTLFVQQENDLPCAYMGSVVSSKCSTELKDEGTVVTIKDNTYLNPFDPLEDHSDTWKYIRTFDMSIETQDGSQTFRGTPADIINKQIALTESGQNVSVDLIESIKAETPKESVVGGITLTKLAEVPIDPTTISELTVDPETGDLAFLTNGAQRINLPYCDWQYAITAFKCVFSDHSPELSLGGAFADQDGKQWERVVYVSPPLAQTALGDLMLEADKTLAEIGFGTSTSSKPLEGIPNYHPYFEVARDNEAVNSGKLGLRVWTVPTVVHTVLQSNSLVVDACTMAVRFEAYDAEHSEEYFKGTYPGRRDPAGDFVGVSLTSNFDTLAEQRPVFNRLKTVAAFVGVLIWAHDNNIYVSQETKDTLERAYQEHLQKESGKERLFVEIDGTVSEVVASDQGKEIDESEVSKPIMIFNEFGPSRLLWEDGSESRLEWDNGRLASLTSRQGEVTKIQYDQQGNPLAIVADSGRGIAILRQDGVPFVAKNVLFDSELQNCTISTNSDIKVDGKPEGMLVQKIAAWMKAEKEHESGDVWLVDAQPEPSEIDVSVIESPSPVPEAPQQPWSQIAICFVIGILVGAVLMRFTRR